jgi:hypothetical protein
VETCENCGQVIGELETPYIFEGHVVCAGCHDRVSQRGRSRMEPHPPSSNENRLHFSTSNCCVSDDAVVIGTTSIPTRSIASVRREVCKHEPEQLGKLVAIAVLMFLPLLAPICWVTNHQVYTAGDILFGLVGTAALVAVAILLVRYLLKHVRKARPLIHFVRLTTSGGEFERVQCNSSDQAQELFSAVQVACAASGQTVQVDVRTLNVSVGTTHRNFSLSP